MMTRLLTTAFLALLVTGGASHAKVADGAAAIKTDTGAKALPLDREAGLAGLEDPLALRPPAQVMRVWIAPWEDSHGDLHAATYLYTEITPRRWSLGLPPPDPVPHLIRPLQIAPRKEATQRKPSPAKPQAVNPPGGERSKR
jgi:conjugal transfer pilus assembly protein TraV